MASGYVDWHKRTYTDIIAQSIEKILIDIASASIGQLPVSVAGQTIDTIDIDIKAQTIGRIINAPSYGGARDVQSQGNIQAGVFIKIFEIIGHGIIYGGSIVWEVSDGDANDVIYVNIDGNDMWQWNVQQLKDWSIDEAGMDYIVYHAANSLNYWTFAVTGGITFDSNYTVYIKGDSSKPSNRPVNGVIFYALREVS